MSIILVLMLSWFLNRKKETVRVCFNERCFLAEVARTESQRIKGLMFRKSLAKDKAMLFVFENPSIHNFWMKNCRIPLDIIWLDEDFRVAGISPNNQPCALSGDCPRIWGVLAKYALEINAGLAAEIGISQGSHFSLQNH